MSNHEKMSTTDLMENLREELTCFICLDYFSSPVTTECGHSFCLMCLLKSWEEHNTPLSCPECWRTLGAPHFQANERLGRLANIGRQLRSQVLQSEDEQSICGRMPGPSWVFSDDEQSVINVSPPSQGTNKACFSSEAEEQHKEKLQDIINILRKKKKEVQAILNHEKERVMLCKEVKGAMDRYESLLFQSPETTITELSLCHITGMREMLRKFSNTLGIFEWKLNWIVPLRWETSLFKDGADITLDPATANAYLLLSEDLKSVRYGGTRQQLPDNPERFDQSATVLGAQIFTCGRHYWEVEVGKKTEWEVGICKDSVNRKGNLPKPPGDLFSLIGLKIGDDYSLWVSSPLKGQHVREPVHKVGVFLDYDSGHIAFYNATDESLIYSFPPTPFHEALRPIFSPCLPNEGTNTDPLIICHI
ncbi:probable E3 ubiquitin-protein ligase TRIML1 isoform X7 [Mus musculus]|uniref:probable E3 ubiquitin-protein ligase TRIML1 isoform X7 n=1 Tax=Mus musculus TaxID=10090 RepID=UPI0007EDDC02|nr:probable E3 ubiquitin-protein ligase TRIML1 isoform X7 [Mus musculus]|eukprot:XP_017168292.1 PREDICTED: probable E3 ubiquitin-protein ligase TRIML1 isoform X6 [Mus musculus]